MKRWMGSTTDSSVAGPTTAPDLVDVPAIEAETQRREPANADSRRPASGPDVSPAPFASDQKDTLNRV